MPKVKTNSGAKKRFTFTGTGKIKRKHAYKSHILTKKTKKQKRNLTKVSIVDKANLNSIREFRAARGRHALPRGKRRNCLRTRSVRLR